MLTSSETSMLACLSYRMGKLEFQCTSTKDLKEGEGYPVRGEEGIVDELKGELETLNELFPIEKDVSSVKKEIKKWINYFTRNYEKTNKFWTTKSYTIDEKDAENLADDLYDWIQTIEEHFEEQSTALIKEGTIEKFFPVKLTKKLDKKINSDLKDGFDILIHGYPTPAAMIFFRVAEAIARKHYEKTMGVKNTNLRWNDLIQELRNKSQVKKSLINYLDYLRDKRNEAAHPGKIFSQSEGEQILLHLKGLLEDVSKK